MFCIKCPCVQNHLFSRVNHLSCWILEKKSGKCCMSRWQARLSFSTDKQDEASMEIGALCNLETVKCVGLWDIPTWHSLKSRTATVIHLPSSFAHGFPLFCFCARLVVKAVCRLIRKGAGCNDLNFGCMYGCWLEACCCANAITKKTL